MFITQAFKEHSTMEAWSGPSQGQGERRTALYEVSHRLQITQDLDSYLGEESTKYSAVLYQKKTKCQKAVSSLQGFHRVKTRGLTRLVLSHSHQGIWLFVDKPQSGREERGTDSTYCRGAVFPGSLSKDTAWWRWLRWWWRLPAITANNRWTQPLLPPGSASLIYKRTSGSHMRFHRSWNNSSARLPSSCAPWFWKWEEQHSPLQSHRQYSTPT